MIVKPCEFSELDIPVGSIEALRAVEKSETFAYYVVAFKS